MATVTHRVTTPDTGNTPNTSGSFSPAVGDLLVVFVTKEASALSSPMVSADLTSSVAPTGFTLIRNQGHQSSAAHVGVFVANALTTNTTSRTVTIASGSDAGAGTNITVYSVSGMTRVGADAVRQSSGQTDQAAGTPAPVFGSAALTTNAVLGCIYNATNPAGMTPPSGWTETAAADSGYTTGQVSGIESCFRNSGETGTTITWGSSSASAFASIIVELDTSVPATTGVATVAVSAVAPTASGSGTASVDAGAATVAVAAIAPAASGSGSVSVDAGAATVAVSAVSPTASATGSVSVDTGVATVVVSAISPTAENLTQPVRSTPINIAAAAEWWYSGPSQAASPQTAVTGAATVTISATSPTATGSGTASVDSGAATVVVSVVSPDVSATGTVTVDASAATVSISATSPDVSATGTVTVDAGAATVSVSAIAPVASGSGIAEAVAGAATVVVSVASPDATATGAASVDTGTAVVVVSAIAPSALLPGQAETGVAAVAVSAVSPDASGVGTASVDTGAATVAVSAISPSASVQEARSLIWWHYAYDYAGAM